MVTIINTFFGGNKEMYQYYSSLIAGVFSASLGIAGSYMGAVIGGKKAIESSKMQIDNQEKIIAEKLKEKEKYIISMIIEFIKPEIEYNYNVTGIIDTLNIHLLDNRELEFEEYEKIKYRLLEHPIELVKTVNSLYLLFKSWNKVKHIDTSKECIKILNDIRIKKDKIEVLLKQN